MGSKELREFLDLATWEETTGLSSIFAVHCAWCGSKFRAEDFGAAKPGFYRCPDCKGIFRLMLGRNPIGPGVLYITYRIRQVEP